MAATSFANCELSTEAGQDQTVTTDGSTTTEEVVIQSRRVDGSEPVAQLDTTLNTSGMAEVIVTANRDDAIDRTGESLQFSDDSGIETVVVTGTRTAGNPTTSSAYSSHGGASDALTYTPSTYDFNHRTNYYNSVAANRNPATVAIGATGNTETLYFIKDAALGMGHIAVSINGSVAAGLGRGTDTSMVSATVSKVDGYIMLGADNYSSGPVYEMTINVTQAQALAMQSVIAQGETNTINGTQMYNAFTENCAEFASAVETAGGQPYGSQSSSDFSPPLYAADFMVGEKLNNAANVVDAYQFHP